MALECRPDAGGGDSDEFVAARRAYEAPVNPAASREGRAARLTAIVILNTHTSTV